MKRITTFQLKDSVMSYDGAEMTHVRGDKMMFILAREEAKLIQEGMHPTIPRGYLPDAASDIPELLIQAYGGKMLRQAQALKTDPKVIY